MKQSPPGIVNRDEGKCPVGSTVWARPERCLKNRRRREEALTISPEKFESRHLDSYEEILATMAKVPTLISELPA